MWGSYGANHSGVCIEFCNRSGVSEIFRRAQPVLYSAGSLAERLPDLIQQDLSLDLPRLALWIFFVKSTDWRDEHEWRVFTLSTKPLPPEERFLSFEPKDVRRVFCGSRMDAQLRTDLSRICTNQAQEWALIDVIPDVHKGIAQFDGIDVLDDRQDFEYWFPEMFTPKA